MRKRYFNNTTQKTFRVSKQKIFNIRQNYIHLKPFEIKDCYFPVRGLGSEFDTPARWKPKNFQFG